MCTCVQSYDYVRMLPSMRADLLACIRDLHRTWKRALGELVYKFSCVSECVQIYLYSSLGDFVGRNTLCVWTLT
jgi:hypothetical protein